MLRSQDQSRRGPLVTDGPESHEDPIGPPSSAAAPESPDFQTATSINGLLRRGDIPPRAKMTLRAAGRDARYPCTPGVPALPSGLGPARPRQTRTDPAPSPPAIATRLPAGVGPGQAASETAAVARFWDRYYGSFTPRADTTDPSTTAIDPAISRAIDGTLTI